MNWQPGNTAPKTGQPFIAEIKDWPQAVVCAYSGAHEQFIYSIVQVDKYGSQWNDTYFENEYTIEANILRWMPLPVLGN